ncbi:hypothetical protein [uncultured Senegalimassilia sp.]|uniref:hypothetical protein n=1 Tax=uncultured Senegalimassilia sp. TaxID=1714350 RepID=UPI0025FE9506|nr:hypothetical protein [uncultured Senegalimassilia sp.]
MSNHSSIVGALAHRVKVIVSGTVAVIALALAFATAPASAFAVGAAGAGEQVSPCVPTQEQVESYCADGSLDERVQVAERLGHTQLSTDLTQQALARQAAALGQGADVFSLRSAVPSVWKSGMATVGAGRVLALRVSFPDYSFADDDTLEALDALINGGGAHAFPYESLHAYYERASYGALDISGTAVDYQAKHERSYYQHDINSLFVEALDALDETLDLSQFDGNGDGYIDCVYLHFAGPDAGWGSTWWSQEWTVPQQAPHEVYERSWDGMRLWNACLLADNCAADMAASTLIHETGHVLGLPDLYSYRRSTLDVSGRSGCLTFDLMDNNAGDTNAFFKWMLGWIDESKVLRLVANADGIDVQRDGVTQHYDEHSIDQVLSAFTSSDLSERGGFIAVSDSSDLLDPTKGLFSSFYLLQYDRHAGNQSVVYKRGGQDFELPSGFRLFRVQAALSAEGGDYLYQNTSGAPGNQLIELVDPDMDATHSEGIGYAPAAIAGDGYGCMLYAGQEVSPTTYPSTNFGESIGGGFTGLTFSFGECGEDSGAVTVSWSDAAKPVPGNFSLSLRPGTLLNWGPVTFAMSYPALYKAFENEAFPYFVIDGKRIFSAADVSGETVSMRYQLNPGEVLPTSACEAVFPAGCFLLGVVDGQEVYSEEIRVPFSPSGLASFGKHGFYELETDPLDERVGVSSVFARGDGSHCFLRAVGESLYLETLDEKDPSKVSEAKIDGAVLPTYPQASSVLQCAVLPDDRCLVTVSFENFDASDLGHAYLVDFGSRRVLGEASLSRFPGSVRAMAVGNVPVLGMYAYQLGFGEGYVMASAFADVAAGGADASAAVSAEERVLWTRASGVYDVGDGLIAAMFTDNVLDGNGYPGGVDLTVRLYDAESVAALFATAPAQLDPDALADFTESLDPVRVCKLSGYQAVNDVVACDDAVYVLASGRLDASGSQDDASRGGAIVKFDRSGMQTACRALVPVGSVAATYTDLVVGEQGAVAATRIAIGNKGAFEPQETHLFDSSLNAAGSYDFVGNSTGGWVGGRWVALGWDSSRFGNAIGAGAPPADGAAVGDGAVDSVRAADGVVAREGEEPDLHTRVGYAISDVLDVAADPEDPGDPDDSEDPDDTEGPEEPKGPDAFKGLDGSKGSGEPRGLGGISAGTGDSVPVLPLAIVVVVALAAAIWARRRSR